MLRTSAWLHGDGSWRRQLWRFIRALGVYDGASPRAVVRFDVSNWRLEAKKSNSDAYLCSRVSGSLLPRGDSIRIRRTVVLLQRSMGWNVQHLLFRCRE